MCANTFTMQHMSKRHAYTRRMSNILILSLSLSLSLLMTAPVAGAAMIMWLT